MADTYPESIKKLGFGFMRLPRKGDKVDYEPMRVLVDAFLARGFSYFDTAYVYEGSEESLRETLVRRHPREKFQITTKLPTMMINKREELQTFFDTSLSRLGVDYIDYYLLHGISGAENEKCEKIGVWEFLRKLKDQGKIRHYGFSYHDNPENLDIILTRHPDAELVQLQINYLDWDSKDVQSRRLYDVVRKHNKPFSIMEPVKGGLLAGKGSSIEKVFRDKNPNSSVASWAVRFAASLEGLMVMLSGMTTMEMLEDNMNTIDNLKPLSEDEMKVVRKAVEVLNNTPGVPCTGCRYCVPNCPMKITIPALMDIYNEYLKYNAIANNNIFAFMMAIKDGGKPSQCIGCKACEDHCPQRIGISEVMHKLAPVYEGAADSTVPGPTEN
jgi:predicted aldo/keto reductase-like oxidoreductase